MIGLYLTLLAVMYILDVFTELDLQKINWNHPEIQCKMLIIFLPPLWMELQLCNFLVIKSQGDSNKDLTLNVCRFLLFAWNGNVDINTGVIQYHGVQNRAASDTLICFPSLSLCPERCKKLITLELMCMCYVLVDCGDPGAPDNGNSNFTDTREGSIVTYACTTNFELVGNSTQTCELTPGGAFWSFTRPECIGMFILTLNYTKCSQPGVLLYACM